MQEDWTAIAVGDIEKYNGNDGTASYTVTKNNNGSITISHDAAMALYASCSFKTNFGDNNTLYTKITNNSDVAATVQVQVNKAGTEENDWQPTPTVTAVYVDGKKRNDASEYSVVVTIPANGNVVIANKFDLSKNPDTVAISLNSQEEIAGTVAKGDITVSGISMKNVTDESELEITEDGAGAGTGNTGNAGTGTGNTGTDTGNTGTGNTGTDTGTGEQLPAKMITFSVIEDSTNAEKTTLLFKYDRSAAGAKELVAIEKCGIIVKLNDTKVTKIDKLEFALDEYGSSFDDKDKNPIKDEKNMKEYKAKVSIAKQVKKGDKVVVYYNEGVGTITGEGKEAEAVNSLVVSLVDTDEKVDYYKELVENKNEYQPLFPNAGGNNNQGENNDTNQGDNNNGNNQGNSGEEGENKPVSVTVADCNVYEVVLKKDVEDPSIIGIVFQIDSPNPEKEADGLKINISNLKLTVTVDDKEIDSTLDSVTMVPNQWSTPSWTKTDARVRLGLPSEKLEKDTKITVQIQSATIDQPEETVYSIIFALQEDAGSYDMVGTNDTMYKSIFAKN